MGDYLVLVICGDLSFVILLQGLFLSIESKRLNRASGTMKVSNGAAFQKFSEGNEGELTEVVFSRTRL